MQVIRTLTQIGQTIHLIFDLDGNRVAEYDYDSVVGTSTLLREYIWQNGQPVAVIEGGNTYYIRTDHIGRPVFATDATATKVWEATYLPFGGVDTSSGANIALRFPGQWFQSESGLHQNWMRDYDPTTGRYLQADPLGLVDGASVYGYSRQNPGRYVDPRGEAFGPVGAIIGGGTNAALQFFTNWAKYGDALTAARCIDIKDVAFSAGFGFLGAGILGPIKARRYGSAAGIWGLTTYYKKSHMPIRIGDECECDGGKSFGEIGDTVLDLIGSSHF